MNNKTKMKRTKQKGITLIALVVTIVVLIILATVSINAVVGENGLIRKAEQAKELYNNSKIAEEEAMNTLAEQYDNATTEQPVISTYEVKYNFNTQDKVIGTLPETTKAEKDKEINVDEGTNYTRSGYKFVGWALENNTEDTITSFIMPENEVELFAVWVPSKLYLYNNGTVNTDAIGTFIAEDKWLWGASKATAKPSLTLNSNGAMIISQYSSLGNTYESGDVISTKAVNLKNYDTCTINFTCTTPQTTLNKIAAGSSGGIYFLFVDSELNNPLYVYGKGEFDDNSVNTVRGLVNGTNYTESIDISGVNGYYFPCFKAIATYFTSETYRVETKVHSIVLE